MTALIVLLVLVALFGLFLIAQYNKLVALRNRFIDIRRRARFHGGSIEDIDTSLFAQQASQETVVYFEQTAREFWRLSPAHREIITMIGINGMSYEQVAKVLGCPIGTVRSRLARARAELQGAIDGKTEAQGRPSKRAREIEHAA